MSIPATLSPVGLAWCANVVPHDAFIGAIVTVFESMWNCEILSISPAINAASY
jgi:hypothetical protein